MALGDPSSTEPTPYIPPDWLELARKCVTEADWVEIVKGAVKSAKGEGNDATKAREFLASFVLPKDKPEAAGRPVKEVRLVLVPKPPDARVGV